MNLDDLMAVWRSQDAAPLHGVDKTLLHLALRQDEAKLQKQRRIERWIIYLLARDSSRHGACSSNRVTDTRTMGDGGFAFFDCRAAAA